MTERIKKLISQHFTEPALGDMINPNLLRYLTVMDELGVKCQTSDGGIIITELVLSVSGETSDLGHIKLAYPLEVDSNRFKWSLVYPEYNGMSLWKELKSETK